MTDKNIVLKTVSISKSFPGVKALNNVDFDLLEGEIHAICGENGAGKSTFCNVLTGIVRPDNGKVFLNGEEIRLTHPSQALRMGIRMVYQERNLIPYLTGAQNILLREEPVKGGFLIDEKSILSKAEELSELYNLRVPLGIPVALLSSAQRQAIEILRAFLYKPKILILDEPTSSLTESEVKSLFSAIHQIKNEGVSVILITHKLEEVFENADRISIFRNGERVTTRDKKALSEEEAIRLMVNRNISSLFPEVTDHSGDTILQVENLSGSGFLKDISIHLKKGEVLGLYGLIGSGRTELIEHLYGLRETKTGRVIVKGKEVQPNVHKMIEEGVFLVPDDRREKGLLTSLNLKKNLTISYINEFSKLLGVVSTRRENALVKTILDKSSLSLKYSNINQDVQVLSGGNQQKVVIGRWISKGHMSVLILDDPTNGIDVGTKFEIYKMIRNLAEEKSVGVIFISSELPELIGVCDRLYVFKEGRISGELSREEFDDEKILSMAL